MGDRSRTPVIIGVAQHVVRDGESPEPLEGLALTAVGAIADAQARASVTERIDAIGVVQLYSWDYDDPATLLARRIGASPRYTTVSRIGGNAGQQLLTGFAERMLAGEIDVALVAGSEALATLRRLQRNGQQPQWSHPGPPPDRSDIDYHPSEVAHEAFDALHVYPMLDTARRARLGFGIDEHRRLIGEVAASMTEVAAANPYAWFPVKRSASEIATPSPDNRHVAHPYTKFMCAVMDVDQSAAVLLATAAAADDLGVPEERRVYLHGWADAVDIWYTAQRPDLSRSPAMAAASRAALNSARVGLDDVAWFDFYSCFPVAVATAVETLGLRPDDPRGVTVTGGLPYAGGPANNYTTHSIAAMTERLRDDPGALGVVSALGWFVTKHGWAVYGSRPPGHEVLAPDRDALQKAVDAAAAARPLVDDPSGPATVAAYTVVHDRSGAPQRGMLIGETPDGRRFWAELDPDPTVLAHACEHELVGARGSVRRVDGRNRFSPGE